MTIRFISFVLRYTLLAAMLIVALSSAIVLRESRGYAYSSIEEIPANDVGLLLGTSPYMRDGSRNPFFESRVAAAVALYESGRISTILASGDNLNRSYDEPEQMRAALLERGVPAEAIATDPAGYRTLDSIVRAGREFGLRQYTIISQEYHNHRALFIARRAGHQAIAFNAADVSGYPGLWSFIRELLARTLAVYDVFVMHTEPVDSGVMRTD